MMKRERDFVEDVEKIRGYYNERQYRSSTSCRIVKETITTKSKTKGEIHIS